MVWKYIYNILLIEQNMSHIHTHTLTSDQMVYNVFVVYKVMLCNFFNNFEVIPKKLELLFMVIF